MDFIERIFGISADGGNGMLEACMVLVPVVIVAILYCGKAYATQRRR